MMGDLIVGQSDEEGMNLDSFFGAKTLTPKY